MAQSLQEIFLPRAYLTTYYPSSFDERKFILAVDGVRRAMGGSEEVLNVDDLAREIALPHEIVENAALFHFLREVSRQLLEAFPRGEAVLLDIGGGPTVYQHIPLCLNVTSIIHGEFLQENREEVLKYLMAEKSAYVWTAYFRVMRKLLRDDQLYRSALRALQEDKDEEIRERALLIQRILLSENDEVFMSHLRRVLSGNVVPCDVFSASLEMDGDSSLSNVLIKNTAAGLPDVLSVYFLVESATEQYDQWERGMEHLVRNLRPGGFFIMTAIRNAHWYRVGNERVPAVAVNEGHIRKFLEEHGIIIQLLQILMGSDQERHGYDGMVFVFGKKAFS